jgi:hypothetical protein
MSQSQIGYRIKRTNYAGYCEMCKLAKPPEKVTWMPDFAFNASSGHQRVLQEMRRRQCGWLCVDCFVKIQMKK